MITLYGGKLGCGKSYSATAYVWKLIHEGKDCYVNWKIDFTEYYKTKHRSLWYKLWNPLSAVGKVYYWETLDDLYQLKNGEVFFDEAHMAIDARDFAKLPKDFKTKLTQSRKYGLNLHFISQHSQQIDIAVRRLANEYVQHTKFWRFFIWRAYDGEAIERLSNPLFPAPKSTAVGFYWFSKKFAKSYDTFALFKPFEAKERTPMWDIRIINRYLTELRKKRRWFSRSDISAILTNSDKKGGDTNDREVSISGSDGRGNRRNAIQGIALLRPEEIERQGNKGQSERMVHTRKVRVTKLKF